MSRSRDQVGSFELQDATRAAQNAFAAGQAMAIFDRYAQPGMPAHVDINRAIEGTNAALNAALRLWNNLSGSEDLAFFGFWAYGWWIFHSA